VANARLTRTARRYMKKIRKAASHYELQEIASNVQNEVDRRKISFDEALSLGNSIQTYADRLPGNTIVYAISNRDSYRSTLELYLKDGYLSKTEQLLLWEERRRLGIKDVEHNKMLHQLVDILERRGTKIIVSRFEEPVKGGSMSE
jgi:hypothetical protein